MIFGKPFYVNDMELYDANKMLYNRILELMLSITDKADLKNKHITLFDEWSKINESKQTS